MTLKTIALYLGWAAACLGFLPTGAAAQDALKRIAEHGQVNVGYSEDAPPFSFKDGKGAPSGYSLDFCTAIVDLLRERTKNPNLRLNLVPVSTDQLPRLMASTGIDLMCAGVSDTKARRSTMDFSSPIFISAVKLAVRSKSGVASATELKGKSVAVMGRTSTEPAVKAYSDANNLRLHLSRVVSAEAALGQLRLSQSEAWARDETLLLGVLARQADGKDFRLLPDVLAVETIGIAFPPDAGLRALVDEAMMKTVRSGRADALYEQWFIKPNQAVPAGMNLSLSPALKTAFDRLR